MKHKSPVPVLFFALLAVCVLPLGYAAAVGREELALLGLIPAVLMLIGFAAYKVRSLKDAKIIRLEGHLLHFEYAAGEVEEIIECELPKLKKTANALALFLGVCLMLIFAPFSSMIVQNDPASPVWAVWISLVLVPVLGALIASHVSAARMRRMPCVTTVGPDYILIANRYPGINDYGKLRLAYADFIPGEPNKMRWMRLVYSFVAMRGQTKMQKQVHVPVPYDKTGEAEAFVREIQLTGRAKKKPLRWALGAQSESDSRDKA